MTYSSFLSLWASNLGRTSGLSADEKTQLTNWLNQGLAKLWVMPSLPIWPWTVTKQTKTLADYATPLSGLANPNGRTVWSQDPETLFAQGKAVKSYFLASEQTSTTLTVQAATATAEVVIFTRSTLPVYVVDDTTGTEFPDVFMPWLSAEIRYQMLFWGMVPRDPDALRDTAAMRADELEDLKEEAQPTWENAPWLQVLTQNNFKY